MMHPFAEAELRRRQEAVAAYKREHMTPAIREAMAFWQMSEEEYDRRLMAILFPSPITYADSSTDGRWLDQPVNAIITIGTYTTNTSMPLMRYLPSSTTEHCYDLRNIIQE